MATKLGEAFVRVRPDAKGFGKELERGTKPAFSGLAKAAAGAFAGVQVASFLKGTVKEAADAEQSIGAVDSVFKAYAKNVQANSKKADTAVGLSANSYREMATLIGSQLKNAGTSMDTLGPKTDKVIRQGADLAAQFGGPTENAVAALSSAFKGELDPIEKYGITLTANSVQAEAMALGLVKGKGPLTQSAKAQATLSLITKQSADAQGAFARESDTAAGKAQRASAQWENMRTALGTKLLPAFTAVTGGVSSFLGQMESGTGAGGRFAAILATAGNAVAAFGRFVRDNSGAVLSLTAVMGGLLLVTQAHTAFLAVQAAGGMAAWIKSTRIVTALTRAWTAVQWLLNAALRANPIGLVITGLTLLGGGLVLAYKKSETFRNIVNGAFAAVKAVVLGVVNWFKSAVPAAWNFVRTATSTVFNGIRAYFSTVFNIYKTIISTALNVIKTAITTIFNGIRAYLVFVFNVYKTIFTTVLGAIKTIWSGAWTAIKNVATSIWPGIKAGVQTGLNGVKTVFSTVVGAIKTVWDGLKKVVGAPITFVVDTVLNKGLIKAINTVTGVLGLGKKLHIDELQVPRFATGGPIPGHSPSKRADNVPIMATAGEHMLSVDEVKGLGGHARVDQIRQWAREGSLGYGGKVRKYALGGRLPSVTQNALSFIRSNFPGTSSLGTWGRRNNVSDHPLGLAIDAMVSPNHRSPAKVALGNRIASEFASNAGSHGTKYVIWRQRINKGKGWKGMEDRGGDTANHFDHVHISFKLRGGGGKGGFPGSGLFGGVGNFFRDKVADVYDVAAHLAKSQLGKLPGLSGGPLAGMIKGAVSMPIDGIGNWLRGKAEEADFSGGGGGDFAGSGVTRWTNVVLQALKEVGQPSSLLSTTLRRMNKESSGNPRAINNWDINAKRGDPSKGLMQVTGSNFRTYGGKYVGRGIYDPLANVYASMMYALSRYGSLPEAYNRKGGYRLGTNFVPQDGPVYLHRGEAVVPAELNKSGNDASRTRSWWKTAPIDVRVYIGERELSDIVRVTVDDRDTALATGLRNGRS